ncbi:MAG: nitrilase-related carbon-nitrogen hydrolase [Planctomycetota bacterium]
MKVHLVQHDIVWEDKAANHARVRSLVDDAEIGRGDLIVLPEMFDTGFSINLEKAEDGDGRSAGFLAGLAADKGAMVVGGISVKEGDRGRNRALVFGCAGETVAAYDKVHPFSFGREGERFDGGREVVVFDWAFADGGVCRVQPAVCYDLRFPELFRAGLDRGAEAMVVIANWPRPRQDHWRTLLKARAIENQCFVMGVNRTGRDPHLAYAGGSVVFDPRGEMIGEMGEEEGVLSVELDRRRLDQWRKAFGAWLDRKFSGGQLFHEA